MVVMGVGGNASKENPILFLDVGANVGIHGLYAAALGLQLWSVEPQIKNVEKVKQLYDVSSLTLYNTSLRLHDEI